MWAKPAASDGSGGMNKNPPLRAGLSSKCMHSADEVSPGVRTGPGLNTLFRGPRLLVATAVGAMEGVGISAVTLAIASDDERSSAVKHPMEPRYRIRMPKPPERW